MEQTPFDKNNNKASVTFRYIANLNSLQKEIGKNKKIFILIFVLIFAVGAIAAYFFYFKNNNSSVVQNTDSSNVSKSEENEVDRNLDADGDGLPDFIEEALGTDPRESDSDKDGYGDFAELGNGYNPLKPASQKLTREEQSGIKDKISKADASFYEKNFSDFRDGSDFVCGGSTVQDIDGNSYNTVKIGDQCWLKENLKVTKNSQGQPIKRYCYNNDKEICDIDGGLYGWNAAMDNSNQEGAQGICPDGWRVPKDSQWYVLEYYLGEYDKSCDSAIEGEWQCLDIRKKLRTGGSSGFESINAGERETNGSFLNRGTLAQWWSSSPKDGYNAWYRFLDSAQSTKIGRSDSSKEGRALSVRCIKD